MPDNAGNTGGAGGSAGADGTAEKRLAEIEKQLKEKDRLIADLSDKNAKSNEIIQAFMADDGNKGSKGDDGDGNPRKPKYDLVGDPDGTLENLRKEIKQEVLREVGAGYQAEKSREMLEKKFFIDHPDMVGMNPGLIRFYAEKVEAGNPRASIEEKFKGIADSVRSEVQKIRTEVAKKDGVRTPALESDGGMSGAGGGDGGDGKDMEGVQMENPKLFESMLNERKSAFAAKTVSPRVAPVKSGEQK